MTKSSHRHGPERYRIRVEGHLDRKWTDWFEGMTMAYQGGDTIFTGPVADQAALHGLFIRIRDLNLRLISVERIESSEGGANTQSGNQAMEE